MFRQDRRGIGHPIVLLDEIFRVFKDFGVQNLASRDLVAALESSARVRRITRRPLTPVILADVLKPFGIGPRTLRFGASVKKGYYIRDFYRARFLPIEDECDEIEIEFRLRKLRLLIDEVTRAIVDEICRIVPKPRAFENRDRRRRDKERWERIWTVEEIMKEVAKNPSCEEEIWLKAQKGTLKAVRRWVRKSAQNPSRELPMSLAEELRRRRTIRK